MPEKSFEVDETKLRKVITLLSQVYNNPNEQMFQQAKQILESAAEVRSSASPVLAAAVEAKITGDFFESNTKWLNDWIVGVRPGELILVGGWPFSGKTHFMVWLATRFPGAKIDHFYFEDFPEDMKQYYTLGFKGNGGLDTVWFVDMNDVKFSAATVGAIINKQKAEGNKPDIIVLDHIDVMQSVSGGNGNDWLDAVGVVKEVKSLARRENVVAIAASLAYPKTNDRFGMGRFYRAPMVKAHIADVVFMIDGVDHGEYTITREKAKGRDLTQESSKKNLRVNWKTMEVEE
jgi:predicted ATP-dependent serine protease